MGLLWKYLKHYKKLLITTLVLAAINQVFSLLDPQVFRLLIDRYATKAGQLSAEEFLRGVIFLLLAFIGVALVSRIAKNFQDYNVNVIVQKLGAGMYADSVSHSFSLPYAVFEDQRSGEFLQKLQSARTDAQKLIQNGINIMFISLVGVSFVLVYAFWVHWAIGLVYSLMVPLLGATTYFLSRKIQATQKRIITQTASLQGATTETLRNVELVKSLGLESQEIKRLNSVNTQILELELEKVKYVRAISFIQGTMVNGLRAMLMLLLLWLIFRQLITLGEFFSILFYSFFIFNPMAEFGTVATSFQEASASMSRLSQILKLTPEPRLDSPKRLVNLETIEFQGLGFHYPQALREALAGISLSLKGGNTVAFVGPSGSGKTTIVKLLVGLYTPTQGKIVYNNTDLREIDIINLRSRIGLVTQDTQLFAGTIRENLLFVRPQASDEECLKALEAAAGASILARAGTGLDTRIGEGGVKLSGGEKQRLAIARALLRDPDLIIFDEATSSLDSLTEEQITKTIQKVEKIKPGLITILVAHRLSTVAHADKIYVLEKGMIVEEGRHEELLQGGGLYAALWRQQVAAALE
ncbi:MAG: ABC transporter ATP-binding protein [Candidatus Doudnabacteria bacterium RIFCSPHIGHO2_12_FULL_48_11]|uniref:ABC transporter ATP-binding protein n=1 Tax=Candidatus Doudnabacteria bacterium RIFCSPHIGHO2_01_FULL_46_24 TaxID=1817825 RepID=A0A1F5NTK5_9BACT|nr:MAG: ABC transporter ATP-binding protein [Candidatus Doudnabacteria bacterium RIFCSPHIGHO2_01_FULL_46_24]OGE95864.1 MAG: ABC transporter ATP-binding protein [Candidatus Doudnabacteria bacterium RIFCSPHIGHO2_12_FULL_48_11]